MFLVDKYYEMSNNIIYENTIIEKIINSFNSHNCIYKDINKIITKPHEDFMKIVNDLDRGTLKFSNFQHIIVYGSINNNKEYLVNLLLEKIYGKSCIELKDVDYMINGYGNTKTKVTIKQSKYHIIIEPNSNGFDKYLIQEIIQNYAKTEILNILKYKKLFKIVVINKLDNLSYYAQASLRRTMEKYSHICKFVFICDQLSKIIEPIRSRCLLLRVSSPTNEKIMGVLLKISHLENIEISLPDLCEIIKISDNKINYAIWLLELKKYNIEYKKSWEILIEEIVDIILDNSNYTNNAFLNSMRKIREIFYNLFITNILTQNIIRCLMTKLLEKVDDNIELKLNIIEITSIFEQRISSGTRSITHFEALIVRLFYLFTLYKKNLKYSYDLDLLEI
jgi:replication factor C subunit 3/5